MFSSDFHFPDSTGGLDTDIETKVQQESSIENPIFDVIWSDDLEM